MGVMAGLILKGQYDVADKLHGCGMPVLRVALGSINYYPTLEEIRHLSRADVAWPDGKAVFPPHHPNDAEWEAKNGSYLAVHRFEDAVRASS